MSKSHRQKTDKKMDAFLSLAYKGFPKREKAGKVLKRKALRKQLAVRG